MSHAVVRGVPTPAQLAFDDLLEEVVAARGGARGAEARARLSLPQVLFHCLRKYPQDLFMINADTDEKTTNQQFLSQAVSLAHQFLARGLQGKVVVMIHDTHRNMLAVYFAVMFAGAVPYVMINENNVLETTSLLELLQPVLVTCDARYRSLLTSALDQLPGLNPEVLLDLEGSAEETDVNSFQLPEVDPDDTALMLGTSGTTGLPKSVELTHRGLIARLPWSFEVPRSADSQHELTMVTYPPDGIAFLRFVTSCLIHRMQLLLPQTPPSAERLRNMLLKYRPIMLALVPLSADALLPITTTEHFFTIQVLFLTGSLITKKMIAAVKEKLPPSALICEAYGSTETHGGIALGRVGEHFRFSNCVEYKIMDESGDEVKRGETGELYIKAPTLAKGYYKMAQHEAFEDGWYKTGDLFREDEQGHMWFQERKAICFKFMGAHVSPEETELVIQSIEGVVSCVVTGTERGSAAGVVAGGDVTREMVHNAVKASLSEYKWLHGGVAFVPSLPRTGMGKLSRNACKAILQEKIDAGECF